MKKSSRGKSIGELGKSAAAWKRFREAALTTPNRSVGTKLFLLIIAGILLCVLLLGIFSYYRSSAIIQEKVADANKLTAEQTAGRLNLLIDRYEQQMMQTVLSTDFTGLLSVLDLAEDAETRSEAISKIRAHLYQLTAADGTLDSVTLVPLDSNLPPISTSGQMNADLLSGSPFIARIAEAQGNMVWEPTMPKGIDGQHNAPTVALGRYINYIKSHVLLLEIRYEAFRNELQDVKFGENGSAYVGLAERTKNPIITRV